MSSFSCYVLLGQQQSFLFLRVPPNSTVANWPPAFNRNQFLFVHCIVPPFRDKVVLPNPKLAFRTSRGRHAAMWCTIAAPSLPFPLACPDRCSGHAAARATRWEKALNFNYYSSHHPPTAPPMRGRRPNWRHTVTG